VVAFAAAVLTGGASRRMGRDKAFIEVGGLALARRVADAALDAGASSVTCVGGDASGLRALSLTVIADSYPGEGPLGAVLTAFDAIDAAVIAVLACDLPDLDAATVRLVVEALGDRAAVIAAHGAEHHPLVGAYAPASCRAAFTAAFDAGRRAMFDALDEVAFGLVEVPDSRVLRNANRPSDLR